MSNPSIHYESFEADFTGMISAHWSTKLNMRFSFAHSKMKIHKGRRYMLMYDPATKHARLLPIVLPDPGWRS